MRDDTVCEKCNGAEGPAIIAASIVVPIVVVGVPLIVMRLERARVYAYCLYNRWFDIGKFKVVWVNVRSCARAATSPAQELTSPRRPVCNHVQHQLESRPQVPAAVQDARGHLLVPRTLAAAAHADGLSRAV